VRLPSLIKSVLRGRAGIVRPRNRFVADSPLEEAVTSELVSGMIVLRVRNRILFE
jgi:hypothetical protein